MKASYITAMFLAAFSLVACSEREHVPENDGDIRICASLMNTAETLTKGEVAAEEVQTGDYFLSYGSASGERSLCKVTFTYGNGYPLIEEDGAFRFLRWNDMKADDAGNHVLTLDNLTDGQNAVEVPLGEAYAASSVEDEDVPDIVWGSRTIAADAEKGTVDFSLYHRMAKISLEITVNSPGIALDDKDVTVTLKNVTAIPTTFNRSSGTVSAGAEFTDVELYSGVLTQSGNHYVIPSWIFPPQQFDQDNFPKLRIEFDGQAYEGTLNRYMVNDGGDSDDTPVSLDGFEAGRHLTLRARLSQGVEDVEVIFMPVYIRKWEEIDGIGITAKQRGIYTETDYSQLVATYNDDPQDESVLEKYGKKDDASGQWTFDLFKNIGDSAGEAGMPKFKDGNFTMNFHGYSIYGVTDKDSLVQEQVTEP